MNDVELNAHAIENEKNISLEDIFALGLGVVTVERVYKFNETENVQNPIYYVTVPQASMRSSGETIQQALNTLGKAFKIK
jgi:hypothetical protein